MTNPAAIFEIPDQEFDKRIFYDNWVDKVDRIVRLLITDSINQLKGEGLIHNVDISRSNFTTPEGTKVTNFFADEKKMFSLITNPGDGEDRAPEWKILTYNMNSDEQRRQQSWKTALW